MTNSPQVLPYCIYFLPCRTWCDVCRSYVQFHNNVKEADGEEDTDAEGSGKLSKQSCVADLLEKQIAAPLTRVQTALAKETVIWKRGILVMPKVCPALPCPALLCQILP